MLSNYLENLFLENLKTNSSFFFNRPYFEWAHTHYYRIFTLLGHPLTNGLVLLIAMIYSFSLEKFNYFFASIIIIGIVLTQSRIAIILTLLALLVYVCLYRRQDIKYTVIFKTILLIGLSLFLLILTEASPFKTIISGRFQDIGMSAPQRFAGIDYFFNTILTNPGSFFWGKGHDYSLIISSQQFHSKTMISFELGWLMIAIDYGLLVAVPIFFIWLLIVVKSFKISLIDNLSLVLFISITCSLILVNSNNGLLTISTESCSLWFVLSLSTGNYIIKYFREKDE